jgi:hypothetical protein
MKISILALPMGVALARNRGAPWIGTGSTPPDVGPSRLCVCGAVSQP